MDREESGERSIDAGRKVGATTRGMLRRHRDGSRGDLDQVAGGARLGVQRRDRRRADGEANRKLDDATAAHRRFR
ncbi:MAG: hypothetical protein B6D46_11070 [Polyangiaceae bacterium UTPRO1]|nr:MAG: hypothetical protein B6D46_11070 [Polyangiaceae bacterium UTPRO1]